MALYHAIDSVAVNGQMIFGWGWCFSDQGEHAEIQLKFEHEDGTSTWLKCQSQIARVDVLESHPGFLQSVRSGFRFSATMKTDPRNSAVSLYLMTHDGQWESTELHDFFPLGKRMQEDRLGERIEKTVLRNFFDANASSPATETIFLIDHSMGGGANLVSERWAKKWLEEGCAVLELRFNAANLHYELQFRHADRNESVSASMLKYVLRHLDKCQFSRIEVNSLVTFPEVYDLLSFVVRQSNRKNIPLAYYVHDFHALCDSWSLIDQQGNYCGLPVAATCQKCIRQRPEIFPSLQKPSSIADWRRRWKKFLIACDAITFFSESSRLLFNQVYGNTHLDSKCHVIPHEPLSRFANLMIPPKQAPFVIGVIGNISVAKGANLLCDMARLILKQRLPLKIVVIGNVETYEPSEVYFATGSYERSELPRLLEHHGVGLCFLPSVCPETFSFVASEVMQLELPLVCFDLGAQAERVKHYANGLIVNEVTAEAALAAILRMAMKKNVQEIENTGLVVIDAHSSRVVNA